jgi:hypothetical protein
MAEGFNSGFKGLIRQASESFGVVSAYRMTMQSHHYTEHTADNHKRPEKEWNFRSQTAFPVSAVNGPNLRLFNDAF